MKRILCALALSLTAGSAFAQATPVGLWKTIADEPYWDGGTILDPNNGKTYKLRMTPKDGGKTLEVRGFIGFFFRNQQWIRVE